MIIENEIFFIHYTQRSGSGAAQCGAEMGIATQEQFRFQRSHWAER